MVRVCRCSRLFFFPTLSHLNTSSVNGHHGSKPGGKKKKREMSPNVKMKMNEEEGPGGDKTEDTAVKLEPIGFSVSDKCLSV